MHTEKRTFKIKIAVLVFWTGQHHTMWFIRYQPVTSDFPGFEQNQFLFHNLLFLLKPVLNRFYNCLKILRQYFFCSESDITVIGPDHRFGRTRPARIAKSGPTAGFGNPAGAERPGR